MFLREDGGVAKYDPIYNDWTVSDGDPNAPPYCYMQTLHTLGSYLVYADPYYGVVKLFNGDTSQWEEVGIPLPMVGTLSNYMAMTVGDALFVVGYEQTEKQVYVFQYTPDESVGSGGTGL